MCVHRSQWYYKSQKDDQEVISKLQALAEAFPTRGFDEYFGKIRNEGFQWNRKRVLRIYRNMKLGLRRKYKKRLPTRVKQPLIQPDSINSTWSMDFMSDVLTSGRKIRVLNIIDDYNREAIAAYPDFSITGNKVTMVLEDILMWRNKPSKIRVDNGPEFISKHFQQWCETKSIQIQYTQPGKPMQNGFIERFNRTFREDILDAYLFEDIQQLKDLSEKWVENYNNEHPHKSLGGMSPLTFAAAMDAGACSSIHCSYQSNILT